MPKDDRYFDGLDLIGPDWQSKTLELAPRHKRTVTLHNVKTIVESSAAHESQHVIARTHNHKEPLRRVKSLSDFYTAVRSRMRTENRENKKYRSGYHDKHAQASHRARARRSELSKYSSTPYDLYKDQLTQTQAHLDQVLSTTSQTLTDLTSLSASFTAVDEQTSEFQKECETILAAEQKSTRLAQAVAENLRYYDYLEPTTRRLNAAGASSLVQRSEFPEILANIDTCLQYMLANPQQREAVAYGSKYRLLLTRGLTLIRNTFTAALKTIAADVSKRAAERKLNDTALSALLYAKFKNGATELRGLSHEIAIRVSSPSTDERRQSEGEYQGLLNELYQSYITIRTKLLQPLITRKMTEIATNSATSKDLVAFAHSSTNFMRSLCNDEYALWAEWFDDDEMLYSYLDTLCESLYDHLRPRIIHETKLNKLCDTCSLIQARYGQDSEDESEAGSEAEQLDFSRLIRPALQDAQDRLVFLAQGILRNDIQYFKPKPADLDYPRKASRVALSGSRKQPTLLGANPTNGDDISGNPLTTDDGGNDKDTLNERGLQEYYPTLRQAVWLLGRLYRLVQSTVFDSVAHEVVHHTAASLDAAATQIATRVSPTDANLFLLSHLLALKHHTLAFEIETSDSSVRVDFPASIWDLRDGVLNPASWYRAIGGGGGSSSAGGGVLPRVVTDTQDARAELDARLRLVIGNLVDTWSSRMASPILLPSPPSQQPTAVAAAQARTNGDDEPRGRTDERRSFSTASAATAPVNPDADASARLRTTIEREVPLVRAKLGEYLHDTRTREMLLRAVLEDVVGKYTTWLDRGSTSTTANNGSNAASVGSTAVGSRAVRGKGKGRADGVWEARAFGEWAVAAFGLDPSVMDAGDGEGDDRGEMD